MDDAGGKPRTNPQGRARSGLADPLGYPHSPDASSLSSGLCEPANAYAIPGGAKWGTPSARDGKTRSRNPYGYDWAGTVTTCPNCGGKWKHFLAERDEANACTFGPVVSPYLPCGSTVPKYGWNCYFCRDPYSLPEWGTFYGPNADGS